MLSVESVSSIQIGSEREKVEVDEGNSFSIGVDDFAIGSLLEDINFDDLFAGIEDGELPELELDAEMLVQLSSQVEEDSNQLNASPCASDGDSCKEGERKEKVQDNLNLRGDESTVLVAASSDGESGRKTASSSNGSRAKVPLGKRKVKVDWTAELHRRFVQAVEQLGVDKAVPSRILELMGVDCLTRHNIASHLQKYRSHRKHLLAREAEAANRNQRRQQLDYSTGGRREAFAGKREMAVPWVAPTFAFPPPAPFIQHIRPLHVWGHPHGPVDQATPHVWPTYLVRPSSPPPPPANWMSAPSPYSDPARPFWFPHYHTADNHPTRGTPCYPMQPSPRTWFSANQVPAGIPQKMYKQDHNLPIPTNQSDFRLQIDFQYPSKESIDAAIEDVLAKPWLPLSLGLKPPSTESVLVELQRQGLSNVPPPLLCLISDI